MDWVPFQVVMQIDIESTHRQIEDACDCSEQSHAPKIARDCSEQSHVSKKHVTVRTQKGHVSYRVG